jgi:quercetin dioxygenase-like cupin family protein
MLLEAGGSLGFHTDNSYPIFANVNIALNNPKGCKWLWKDGESLEFNPGDIYTINTSIEHSVTNESDEDRYHMIIHQYDSTEEYKKMMTDSMERYNVQGYFYHSTELF